MTAPKLPALGLLIAADPPAGLRRLLLACSPSVRLVGVRGRRDDVRPDALLVWGEPCAGQPTTPYAVWVDTRDDLSTPRAEQADAIVGDRAELVTSAGPRGIFVGDRPVGDAVPVLAWLRRRIRLARRLSDLLVVRVTGDERLRFDIGDKESLDRARAVEFSEAAVLSAFAVASAVIVTGPDLLAAALAWGAPTVTDPATAAAAGVTDSMHTVVAASRADQLSAARALATDLPRAASLGWAGRRLAESWDPVFGARGVLQRLLPPHDLDAQSTLRPALDELNAPSRAAIRARAAIIADELSNRGVR